PARGPFPPVTLLKPLHFEEPEVEADIVTFLAQNYPAAVQLIFGVQSVSDPSIAVISRLRGRFPLADIALVVDPTPHGSNGKIATLINMVGKAKHEVLVLSDSDIAVPPDYLRRVVSALAQPDVGAVTCPYTGRAGNGFWARLAAMGTSYDFFPNLVF